MAQARRQDNRRALSMLDLTRSTYRVFGPERPDRQGQIWALRRAVLRREALDGYDLCRLAEYPLFVVVSERFRRAFESAGCTGYSYEALDLV